MSDPAILKAEGNKFFKKRDYIEAQRLYAQAEECAPTEPVYPSNLSAALFEQGKYTDCLESISRSWSLLHDGSKELSNDSLSVRLSSRYAKALCHGVRNGSINFEDTRGQIDTKMENAADLHPNASQAEIEDFENIWKQWNSIRDEFMEQGMSTSNRGGTNKVESAKRRLMSLPIFKKCPDPVLEYYTIGHDEVTSLLDSWGPRKEDSIRLDALPDERLAHLSFLFGGVGDARHAFGTLIHVNRQYVELSVSKQNKTRVHLTLLDLHPASLARDLVILHLLDKADHCIAGTELLELQATIFYVYTAFLLPSYCHERFLINVNELISLLTQSPPSLPSWLHVDESSISPILNVLEYWSKPLTSKNTRAVLKYHQFKTAGQAKQQFLSGMDLASIMEQGSSVQQLAMQRMMDNLELEDSKADGSYKNGLYREREWYRNVVKVMVPPAEFWDRHPGFDLFSDMLSGKDQTQEPIVKQREALAHVEETWKPNPTIFDEASTEHEFLVENGYPPMISDPYETPADFADFNEADKAINAQDVRLESPAFFHTTRFFNSVLGALRSLKGKVTIEIICGEVTTDLVKITARQLNGRPAGFPVDFLRMWLSNVPDYTNGIINAAVYTLPSLQAAPEAAVSFNCLLNTGAFKSDEEYCHTYTLLQPTDIPRYLGCRFVDSGRMLHRTRMVPLSYPLPVDRLASREELIRWLTRILFCIIVNGNPLPPPRRINLPNNLGAYIGLLVHLQKTGFPSHWIADFIQTILSNDLVTDSLPYLGRLPIPVSEIWKRTEAPQKVDLSPWHADLEVIIATCLQALPFSLKLPKEFPTLQDIRVYKAINVHYVDLSKHRFFPYWAPLSSPHVSVIGLLFYKPSPEYDAEDISHQIGLVLKGDAHPEKGDLQILLSQEKVDLPAGEIVWKMSRQRYEGMKAAGWEMAAYRTDLAVAATLPVKAKEWIDVSSAE